MSDSISITNGPSKFDLMVALFDRYADPRKQRTVTFEIHGIEGQNEPTPLAVHISSIKHESGDGHSWLIEATNAANDQKYELYYNSKRHSGRIRAI